MRQNQVDTLELEFQNWLKNTELVGLYREGIENLRRSGIFNLLRRMGVPNRVALGSDVNVMASEASFISGFHTSLEYLQYFEERFRHTEEITKDTLNPTFNGDADAIRAGYLTKKDLEKLV